MPDERVDGGGFVRTNGRERLALGQRCSKPTTPARVLAKRPKQALASDPRPKSKTKGKRAPCGRENNK